MSRCDVTRLLLVCLLLVLVHHIHHVAGGIQEFKRVCYISGWSFKRKDPAAQPSIEDIDPFMCTHIIFAFAKINTVESRIEAVDWDDESTKFNTGNFAKLNKLKKKNPRLKTLLSIGGANAGSYAFDILVGQPESRWAFVQNAVDYLRKWNFNGIDLDWEYPGLPEKGTTEETRFLFTELVSELRGAFQAEASATGRSRLLISVAVGAGERHIHGAYEPIKLSKYADFFNVMAYDYHGGWDRFTGANSPLYSRKNSYKFDQSLSQEWTIGRWLGAGVPASKLLLGVAAQGRTFTLKNASSSGVGADARGHGTPGPYIGEKGILSLYEICEFVDGGARRYWDDEQMFPYAVKGKQWVGYDNTRSIKLKANWAMSMHLGGMMLWALDLDDFSGDFCKAGKYPLANAMSKVLKGKGFFVRTPKRNTGNVHVFGQITSLVHVFIILLFTLTISRS